MPLDTLFGYDKPLSHYKPLSVANEEWNNYLAAEGNWSTTKQLEMIDAIIYEDRDIDVCRQQAVRLLQEARERLAQPGVWIKGSDHMGGDVPGGYRFCARGALIWLGKRLELQSGMHMAMEYLAKQVGFRPCGMTPAHGVLANYNDHPATTLDDVLAWFDRAIILAARSCRVPAEA